MCFKEPLPGMFFIIFWKLSYTVNVLDVTELKGSPSWNSQNDDLFSTLCPFFSFLIDSLPQLPLHRATSSKHWMLGHHQSHWTLFADVYHSASDSWHPSVSTEEIYCGRKPDEFRNQRKLEWLPFLTAPVCWVGLGYNNHHIHWMFLVNSAPSVTKTGQESHGWNSNFILLPLAIKMSHIH